MRLAEERHLTLMPRRFFRVIKVKNAKQYFWQLWSLRNRFFGAGSEQLLYYFEDGVGDGVGGGDRERPAPHGLGYDASIADKNVKGKKSDIISERIIHIPHQQNLEKVDTHSAGGGGRQKQNPASEHEADENNEPQVAPSVGKSTSVDRDLPDHEKTALLEKSSAPGEDDSAPTSQVFQTVCRFRPKSCFKETAGNKAVSGNKVTIPLHQRVALLREKGYSKIDAQQKALAFERSLHEARKGRDEVGADSSSTTSAQVGAEGDRAAAKSAETSSSSQHQLRASILNYTSNEVFTLCPGVGAKRYGFDHVFAEDSKTGEVFDHMLPLINSFLNGEDSCVFCYGQTGSGKTFTMFGKESETSVENLELLALNVYPEDEVSVFGGGGAGSGPLGGPNDHFRQAPPHVDLQAEMLATTTGLIPQSLVYLLRRKPKKLRISLSFVEVFGHTVRDLLTGKVVISLVSDPPTERPLEAVEDIHRFLQDGSEHKRAAATAMNEQSTRAHAVVLAKLFCPAGRDEADSLVSQLILLDLGGSEKLARSKVHELVKAPGGFVSGEQVYGETTWQEYYQSRTRVQETAFINLGLLSLKRCIAALLEEAREMKFYPANKSRIPFYDSKLTQIMRPSLLSRNLLCVICAGVEDANAVESIASLRFGEACRQLGDCSSSTKDGEGGRGRGIGGNNSGKKGSDLAESVRVLDLKIAEVREQIKKKERWEWREAKREHVVDTMDTANTAMNPDEEMELGGKGAVEFFADDGTSKKEKVSLTVAGQQLVGAEEENELLAKLLDQRRMLTGE